MRKHSGISFFVVYKNILAGAFLILGSYAAAGRKTGVAWNTGKKQIYWDKIREKRVGCGRGFPCNLDRRAVQSDTFFSEKMTCNFPVGMIQ